MMTGLDGIDGQRSDDDDDDDDGMDDGTDGHKENDGDDGADTMERIDEFRRRWNDIVSKFQKRHWGKYSNVLACRQRDGVSGHPEYNPAI